MNNSDVDPAGMIRYDLPFLITHNRERFTPDPVTGFGLMEYLYNQIFEKYGPFKVSVKWFQDHAHGVVSESKVEWVDYEDLASIEDVTDFIPSISGVFEVLSCERFVIPMMDLEIISSPTSQTTFQPDISEFCMKLAKSGNTGWIIRSGDSGKGSHWYIADYALPYNPYFWKSSGNLMLQMTETVDAGSLLHENILLSNMFAARLLDCTSIEEAQEIGASMLLTFPSQVSGLTRRGLLYDPRWEGHKLIEGTNPLVRTKRTKGYTSLPSVLVDIC